MPAITCRGENCPNRNDRVATYRHLHETETMERTVPALGPTPNSVPFPQPCPNDGTPCEAAVVACRSCGWTREYPG